MIKNGHAKLFIRFNLNCSVESTTKTIGKKVLMIKSGHAKLYRRFKKNFF